MVDGVPIFICKRHNSQPDKPNEIYAADRFSIEGSDHCDARDEMITARSTRTTPSM